MSFDEALMAFRDYGFGNPTATVCARLVQFVTGERSDLPIQEEERWRYLGILDSENRLVLGKGEKPDSGIVWILIGLAWEELVKRSIRA